MAPALGARWFEFNWNASKTSLDFESQWSQPGDVFTVLLLIGSDVIARALAQLAGQGFTPVTFSFGMLPNRSAEDLLRAKDRTLQDG